MVVRMHIDPAMFRIWGRGLFLSSGPCRCMNLAGEAASRLPRLVSRRAACPLDHLPCLSFTFMFRGFTIIIIYLTVINNISTDQPNPRSYRNAFRLTLFFRGRIVSYLDLTTLDLKNGVMGNMWVRLTVVGNVETSSSVPMRRRSCVLDTLDSGS